MEKEINKVYLNLPKYLYSDSDSDVELVPVSELLKFREFDRLQEGKFSKKESYDNIKLLEDVYKNEGITSVLIIEYSLADNKVLLIEGNHRLNVALELGVRYLPARVVKRNSSFPSLQKKKAMDVIGVVPDKYGYVRSNLKPSAVGIQGTKSIITGNESIYENGGQILLAPNGKPSNLTPEQYKLVRTTEFINWFGDWETLAKAKLHTDKIIGIYKKIFDTDVEQALFEVSMQVTLVGKETIIEIFGNEIYELAIDLFPNSKLGDIFKSMVSKVVDDNGEPMVVYHGTTKNFNEFSLKYATKQTKVDWGKLGFYFTSDKSLAEDFTRHNWGLGNKSVIKKDSNVLDCFLSIKNPKIVNARQWTITSDNPDKLRNELINEKYDGYFIEPLNKDDEESWIRLFGTRGIKELINFQYVAFYPNQIKLADGTNTTFDINSPNIRFEEGGELKIGDSTNVGIIEDEYKNQFKINGNWYHKSIVKKQDKNYLEKNKVKTYNGISIPNSVSPKMVVSAFSNPIDNNKVEKYTEIMQRDMIQNDFPAITGYPFIIDDNDVGLEFMSGEKITEEMIGQKAWKVWDGHHRVLAAINANIPYIKVRLERSAITNEKELFKEGGAINSKNLEWLQTMPNIIKEMKKRDGDVQPNSYYERMAKNIIGSHIGASIFNYGEAIKQKLITIDEAKKIIRSAEFDIPNYITELESEYNSSLNLKTSARKMQLRNKLADILKTLDYKTVDVHSGKSKEDLFIQRVVNMIYNGYDFKSKLDIERIATKEFGFDDAKKVRELTEYAILFVGRDISKENDIKSTYDKLVSLYINQPYSTNRTAKSQELGQFSTPAPMAYLMGIYVGIDKRNDSWIKDDTDVEKRYNHYELIDGNNIYKITEYLIKDKPVKLKVMLGYQNFENETYYSVDEVKEFDSVKDAKEYVSSILENKIYLEPTAGNGMLSIAGNPNDFVVNELDFNRYNNLLKDNYKEVLNIDATKPLKFDYKFDGLLANPPFATTKNDLIIDGFKISGLENQIIVNSLGLLKNDARGAFIIGGNTEYDSKGRLKSLKDRAFFSYLFSRYNVDDVINVSGTLYGRQGTTYPIRIILFNGRKSKPEGFFPLKNDKLSLYEPFSTKVINNFDELYQRFEKTLLKTR